MIVYRIYDRETGKSYIGQTSKSLSQRIYAHLHSQKSAIGEAMRKRGQENFDVSVLDVCDNKKMADKAEKFWIKFYNATNNGYNIHEGGTPDKKWMDDLRKKQTGEKRRHSRKYIRKQEIRFFAGETTNFPQRNMVRKEDVPQWQEAKRERQEEGMAKVREMITQKPKPEPLLTAKEIHQHETEWLKQIAMQQRMFS